jgi:LAO/AO transport system kinase
MTVQNLEYYLDGIKKGDRRILAKAITLVESSHPDHRALARRLVESVLPLSGKAVRVGVTGVPGVGKSTFVENFGTLLIEKGHKVAVLAVDPSSQRSGGSILADKTRMEKLAVNPGAFIRPSPSGGTLGGVAKMTRETILVCEAAGFDVTLVETVGVGQSETTVAGMVDFFLILMLTGAGDVLQGIKKGILELADAVAINKADGDNIERAEKTRKELEAAMHLLQPVSATWTPPVMTCSAVTLEGLAYLWDQILEHNRRMTRTGELQEKRKTQALQWMWAMIEDGLKERFFKHPQIKAKIAEYEARIKNGKSLPTTAARELLFLLDNK